jgi:hypothetical protein
MERESKVVRKINAKHLSRRRDKIGNNRLEKYFCKPLLVESVKDRARR